MAELATLGPMGYESAGNAEYLRAVIHETLRCVTWHRACASFLLLWRGVLCAPLLFISRAREGLCHAVPEGPVFLYR
jgi:hypothetical protein